MRKKNRNFDLYGCYVANKIGYSDNYEFCLNYCQINSDIDYICLYEKEKDKYNMNNVCLSYYVFDDYFDNSENDLYYRIKNLFGDFEKQNDDLNSQNLLLQKYLTQLTKEKMDLLVQINLCMNRLDNIEKYLGINIAAKRMKKNLTNK